MEFDRGTCPWPESNDTETENSPATPSVNVMNDGTTSVYVGAGNNDPPPPYHETPPSVPQHGTYDVERQVSAPMPRLRVEILRCQESVVSLLTRLLALMGIYL